MRRLNPRYRRALRLVAAGLSNREIGERLGLTEGTAKNYVSVGLAELGYTSRARFMALAWKRRLRMSRTANQRRRRRISRLLPVIKALAVGKNSDEAQRLELIGWLLERILAGDEGGSKVDQVLDALNRTGCGDA